VRGEGENLQAKRHEASRGSDGGGPATGKEDDMTDTERRLVEQYLRQPYIGEALRVVQRGKAGRLQHINVYHDADCSLLAGRGFCNCSPTVEARQEGEEC